MDMEQTHPVLGGNPRKQLLCHRRHVRLCHLPLNKLPQSLRL